MSEAKPGRTGAGAESHDAGTEAVGRLLSVNVGMPKDVPWQGRTVFTGVFKDGDVATLHEHTGRLHAAQSRTERG